MKAAPKEAFCKFFTQNQYHWNIFVASQQSVALKGVVLICAYVIICVLKEPCTYRLVNPVVCLFFPFKRIAFYQAQRYISSEKMKQVRSTLRRL